MKTGFIFLLCLCSFFFGSKAHAAPAAGHTQTLQKNLQLAQTMPVNLSFNTASLADKDDDILTIEDDDEDSDHKHVFLARCILAFCCSFILARFFSRFKAALPLCELVPAAPSYIFQRVLRL